MTSAGLLSGDIKEYVSLTMEIFSLDTPAWPKRSMMWVSTPHVIGLIKPSGGGGINDELIFNSCDTNEVGSFGIQLPITIRPPGFVTLTISLATSKGLGANMAPNTDKVKSNEWLLISCSLHASPSWNVRFARPISAARLFPASIRFLAMSIPTTSAPKRARGIAVVPSPQPRSNTLIGGVTPRDETTASPDCRIKAAISVKSPFSHNALFGFIFVWLLDYLFILLFSRF